MNWVMGRALWRRSRGPPSLASSPEVTSIGGTPARDLSALSPAFANQDGMRRDYFGLDDPPSKPISFTPLVRPPRPPIVPLPSMVIENGRPISVGFFVARTGDIDSKNRLRAEVQNTDFIYSAGLPILPTVASWTDRFGNFMCLRYLPPQGVQTLREMYITPFTSSSATSSIPPFDTHTMESLNSRKGIISVLGRFLDHIIQLVSAVEVCIS